MTELHQNWIKIYESLTKGDTDYYGQSMRVVDVYHLTSHITELHIKIAELEARLDKEEEYRQEQNDR